MAGVIALGSISFGVEFSAQPGPGFGKFSFENWSSGFAGQASGPESRIASRLQSAKQRQVQRCLQTDQVAAQSVPSSEGPALEAIKPINSKLFSQAASIKCMLRTLSFPIFSMLRNNKAKQFVPGGTGHSLRSRRCLRRYTSPHIQG